ncbi:MAG: zf-HC2 domain-containing protein [Gemmatimonadaceae bacterium]
MRSEHQTEESLHAWLDNELTSRESVLVGEHVEVCDACSATLAECRETRATVSYLLQSYDNVLESAPTVPRAERQKLSLSSRAPSAPIINHIVANSKSIGFWPAAKAYAPIAAAAMFFVGGAAFVMMRTYHVVAGSVSAFASTAHKPFVSVDGKVIGVGGRPLAGITISVRGTSIETKTDEFGY